MVYSWDDMKQGKSMKGNITKLMSMSKLTAFIFVMVFILGFSAYVIERRLYDSSFFHALNLALVLMFIIPLVYRDISEQIIPNKFILVGFSVRFITLVMEFFYTNSTQHYLVLTSLAGLLLGGGIFLFSAFIIKNSVGMGDVKLFAVIGFYVGLSGIFSVLFYTLLSSVIVGLVLMVLKRKSRKDSIPLAPFALIGMALSIILGI